MITSILSTSILAAEQSADAAMGWPAAFATAAIAIAVAAALIALFRWG